MTWLPEAYQALRANQYPRVIAIYEAALQNQPEEISHYFYLGLAYLLTEAESEAQATWIYSFSLCPLEEIDSYNQQLAEILATEAQVQEESGNIYLAWLLRVHLKEISPQSTNNLLKIIDLEIAQNQFNPENLVEMEYLSEEIDESLLADILAKVTYYPALETVNFVQKNLNHISNIEPIINSSLPKLVKVAYEQKYPAFSAEIVEIFLKRIPDNLRLLNYVFAFYAKAENLNNSLEKAKLFYENSSILTTKLYGNYLILFCLLKWGVWQEVKPFMARNKQLLEQLLLEKNPVIEPLVLGGFSNITTILPYLGDRAVENRRFTNLMSGLFHTTFIKNNSLIPKPVESKNPIRIGYIAHTMRRHSVGWLSRWLIHHHDRDKFTIGIYLVGESEDEITEKWFKPHGDFYRNLSMDAQQIAEQIQADAIDILVDLDSLTYNITCQVLALKPAPIQVTWLGWDASGLPTIDYYIADPYVLPPNAEDYYQEKIWRLPETYLAVDGFEVGIPTRTRKDLNIPEGGIIYLSVQSGLKRHPDTIHLQMKILKGVENSYFLIKGVGDQQKIRELFSQIALEEGVNPERLYFLPQDDQEATHRANLAIADVVLDTYPYNGATTTLEVLWMEIPLVTRVGGQFAARNSYTFMVNAGLTEAMASTDQGYVDWGIRLGREPRLREQIAWKLRKGKQTAPLWNARRFTRQMEEAYRQMVNGGRS